MLKRELFTSLFVFLLSVLNAQENNFADQWVIEDHSKKAEIIKKGDFLEIISPDGLTLWSKEYLSGDYEITYDIKMIMQNGPYDRLSDMNCFWGAKDPLFPNDLFVRSEWRDGAFKHYNTLNLFYVGYGGNENTTTRFRQYFGGKYDMEDSRLKPLIKEYKDSKHLLIPDLWYHICIRVEKSVTTYSVNDEKLFELVIKDKDGDGYFGLRLLTNHVVFGNFKVKKID